MSFPVARPPEETRQKLLEFIENHWKVHERPPLPSEMAPTVGLATSTIYHHLNVMEAKGMITRQRGYIEIP